MPERSHLSIGEVLSLLQDEFPDVTISKIRFLESQGLIDPERTPSGYRKFYEADIGKLRWILLQQRDNFLPLKVIKDRLDENGGKVPDESAPAQGSAADGTTQPSNEGSEDVETPRPVWMVDHAKRAADGGRRGAMRNATRTSEHNGDERAAAAAAEVGSAGAVLDPGASTTSLTSDELLRASGLTAAQLRSLEQFGLLHSHQVGQDVIYEADAVIIAQKAATFLRHGIEARHLRMFKVAAEREAGFLEQVVAPLLKQRNPTAVREAVSLLDDLTTQGAAVHRALLRQALRSYVHPTT